MQSEVQFTIIAVLVSLLVFWFITEFLHWPVLIVLLLGVVLVLLATTLKRRNTK